MKVNNEIGTVTTKIIPATVDSDGAEIEEVVAKLHPDGTITLEPVK